MANDNDHGDHGKGDSAHVHVHPPMYYVKIWALLLVLLVISILGPMLGHRSLTIITAFGIAIVKAGIVAAFFMHLNIEKRYIWQLLTTMLVLLGLFFAGTAADIMKFNGQNWVKTLAKDYDVMFKAETAKAEHEEGAAEHHQ